MDRFAGISAFIYLSESCDFADAGRKLGISPSAVGRRIASLEERLVVRLFERNAATFH